MNPLIVQHLDAIRALAREYGVARLEIFGSATTGGFDPKCSDLDFIVDYPPGYEFCLWHTRSFELKERLEILLGRPVDRVMAGAMRKPRVVEAANESRRLRSAGGRPRPPRRYPRRGRRHRRGHRGMDRGMDRGIDH